MDKNANSRQHRELVCKVECVCIVQVVSRTFAACECLFIYLLLRLTLTKLAEKQWKTSKDMNFIEVQHSRCLQICSFHKHQGLHWWSDFWTIFLSFSSAFACMHCAHEWTTKCLPAVNGSVQYNYWTACKPFRLSSKAFEEGSRMLRANFRNFHANFQIV